MMVKSLSRKQPSFRQLFGYMDKGATTHPPLTHNLAATDREEIIREFMAHSFRLPKRKNGNQLYHEILSFSTKEEAVPAEAIHDLAQHYIALRGRGQLAYGRLHLDQDNPHVHICFSAGDLRGRRVRMGQREFAKIKKELEAYQRQRFPELQHSLCQDGPSRGRRASRGEQEAERRNRSEEGKTWRPTRREAVAHSLREALSQARNAVELTQRLTEQGIRLQRRGKGLVARRMEEIQSGRKMGTRQERSYRLDTLGLADEFRDWEARQREIEERRRELERMQREIGRERGRDRER